MRALRRAARRLLLLAPLAAAPAAAEELVLTLDPEATEISFTLGATLHTVRGTVAMESGELRFDPAGGELAGRLVVDATSAETGNAGRDRDMHRKVLESDRFGRFVLDGRRLSGKLSHRGVSRVEIHGELSIHGGRHAVVLPAEVSIDGDRLFATCRLEIPYVAWGMKDPSKLLLRVSKVVQVEIAAVGRLTRTVATDPNQDPSAH